MGLGQSSTPQASQGSSPQKNGYPGNNNDGDVVVIPVDASRQAEAAFLWYVKHVHRPENVVRVVHCQELAGSSPVLAEHAFRTDSWADMVERSKQQSRDILEKYEKKLEENKIQGSVNVGLGKPGETVIGTAEKHNATMIVMGTRGFGIVRRTILGSVSEYVIHHTKIPVTVIPRETTSWFF